MKTIQISDELYKDLIEIAKEYVTQNKRGQAEPCMFTPKQQVIRLEPDSCGTHFKLISDDGEQDFDSEDDLKQYYNDNKKYYKDEGISFEDLCEDFREVEYSIVDSFENRGAINPFFTAKYCDIYIHNDNHNLEDKKAKSYAFTPIKNFEMTTMAKLLTELGKNYNHNEEILK